MINLVSRTFELNFDGCSDYQYEVFNIFVDIFRIYICK